MKIKLKNEAVIHSHSFSELYYELNGKEVVMQRHKLTDNDIGDYEHEINLVEGKNDKLTEKEKKFINNNIYTIAKLSFGGEFEEPELSKEDSLKEIRENKSSQDKNINR